MRQFQMIALGKLARIERDVKHTIVQNMLLFTKFSEAIMRSLGDRIREAIIDSAI